MDDFKVIQVELLLVENHSEKRIKVRMREEDKKLIMGILKENFKVVGEREVEY